MTTEEINRFREDTTGCKNVVHLNNAGSGLMPDIVTRAIQDHITLESRIGGYEAAAIKAAAIEDLYIQAGRLFHTSKDHIAFTASATDSFSRALSSIPFQPGDTILTDNDDFISNQIQFLAFQKRFGVRIHRIKNAPEGGCSLDDLQQQLDRLQPRLLAITHIPTNAGLIQPVHEIGGIYNEYRQRHPDKTWYILDACQSAGQLSLDVSKLYCDFCSITVRKFLRGPRGTGLLYVSDRALQSGLEPLFIDMRGAEWVEKDEYQPRATAMRFEDWEFPYALVLGAAEAIKYYLSIDAQKIEQRLKYLSSQLRTRLGVIKDLRILDRGSELGALVTFTIKGQEPRRLVQELAGRKINVVPSFRNFAIIDFDEKEAQWALRASPHYYNTEAELEIFASALEEIIA